MVGHIEWVQFARVPHVPRAGEVTHAYDCFEEPAGGGAVAAVQLARLAGGSLLLTALGEDELAQRSVLRLRELGVDVRTATRAARTRRAVTLSDEAGERTITTFGARLQPLAADQQLPWSALADMDAIYFTAGDEGALRAARAARVLVASPRARDALGGGIPLDALVLSEDDEIERRAAARAAQEAELVLTTRGKRGGTYRTRGGETVGRGAASCGCGRQLRLRRCVRRGICIGARHGEGPAGGACAGGALRLGVRDGPRAV